MWELPAGKIDAGETALQAAKRELVEETGLRAKKWEKLALFYPSPGYVEETMTIYLATELTQGESQPMDDERIEDALVPARRSWKELIRTNKITDAEDDDLDSYIGIGSTRADACRRPVK